MGYRSCYGHELTGELIKKDEFSDLLLSGHAKSVAEQHICSFFNAKYAQLLSTASAGLKSSLMSLRPTPGNTVVVPRVGFISEINMILSAGLIPIILDVDKDNHLSPSALADYLSTNPKPIAIIVSHLDGSSANITEILRIARDVPIIEDCAQSFGAKFNNKYVGTFGKFGCFSFNCNKIISSGEGGLVLCANQEDYINIVRYSNNGSNLTSGLLFNNESFFGENYAIADVCSALIAMQLQEFNYIKESLFKNYKHITSLLKRKGLHFTERTSDDIFISVKIHDRSTIQQIKRINPPYVIWKDSDLLANPILKYKLSPYNDRYPWNLVGDKTNCIVECRKRINNISLLIPISDEKLHRLMHDIERI